MAIEHEVERLIVRIIGDASHYARTLATSVKQTQKAAAQIEASLKTFHSGSTTLINQVREAAQSTTTAAREAATAQKLVAKDSVKTTRESADASSKAMKQQNKDIADATRLLQRHETKQEEFARARVRIRELEKVGQFTPNQASRLITAEQERVFGHEAKLQKDLAMSRRVASKELNQAKQLYNSIRHPIHAHNEQIALLTRNSKKLGLTNEELTGSIHKLNRQFMVETSSLRDMAVVTYHVGTVMAATGAVGVAVFGNLTAKMLMAAGGVEQFRISMSTLMGSVQVADITLRNLYDFAAKTPFEIGEIEVAARGLAAFGEGSFEMMDTLEMLGDAAAGTNTQFSMVALIFNQIRGVGKLLTQDFRQLSTRGLLTLKDIAKFYDTNIQGAQKMLEQGKITFTDVRGMFEMMSKDGGRFANMMEQQSKSLFGLWSNLKDELSLFLRDLGDTLVGFIKPIVSVFVTIFHWVREIPRPLKAVVAGFVVLATVLSAAAAVIGAVAFISAHLMFALNALASSSSGTAIAQLNLAGALASASTAMTAQIGQATLLSRSLGVASLGFKGLAVASKLALAGLAFYGVAAGLSKLSDHLTGFNEILKDTKQSGEAYRETIKAMDTNIQSLLRHTFGSSKAQYTLKNAIASVTEDIKKQKEAIRAQQEIMKESFFETSGPFLGPNTRSIKAATVAVQEHEKNVAALNEQLGNYKEALDQLQATKETETLRTLDNLKQEQFIVGDLIFQYRTFGEAYKEVAELRAQGKFNAANEALAILRATKPAQDLLDVYEEAYSTLDDLQEQINNFNSDPIERIVVALTNIGDIELAQQLKEAASELRDLNTLFKTIEDLFSRGRQVVDQYITPTQNLKKVQDELNQLVKIGAIDIATYQRAMQGAQKDFNDATGATRSLKEETEALKAALTWDEAIVKDSKVALRVLANTRALYTGQSQNPPIPIPNAGLIPAQGGPAGEPILKSMDATLKNLLQTQKDEIRKPKLQVEPLNLSGLV